MTSGPGGMSGSRQLWGVFFDGIRQAFRRAAQRLGGTRVGVLAIGRVISPLQRELYRRTGGRLSLTGRAPVLLLTTTGRRSGKARTVPLLYLRDGDRLVICNVNPGFERPNPWILNLRAGPHAQVQIGRNTASVRARSASEDEVDRYWPQLTKIWPAYQDFYDKGGKRSVAAADHGPEVCRKRIPLRGAPAGEKVRLCLQPPPFSPSSGSTAAGRDPPPVAAGGASGLTRS
jgi:F420H(2)-dependent quinone reductase